MWIARRKTTPPGNTGGYRAIKIERQSSPPTHPASSRNETRVPRRRVSFALRFSGFTNNTSDCPFVFIRSRYCTSALHVRMCVCVCIIHARSCTYILFTDSAYGWWRYEPSRGRRSLIITGRGGEGFSGARIIKLNDRLLPPLPRVVVVVVALYKYRIGSKTLLNRRALAHGIRKYRYRCGPAPLMGGSGGGGDRRRRIRNEYYDGS